LRPREIITARSTMAMTPRPMSTQPQAGTPLLSVCTVVVCLLTIAVPPPGVVLVSVLVRV
jgi:hypothetical protein